MPLLSAELGQNFEGRVDTAKMLIQVAAPLSDIIKLQYWNVAAIYRKDDVRYLPTKERALLFGDVMKLVELIKQFGRVPCVSCFGANLEEYKRLYDAGVLVKYASSEFDVYREHAQLFPQRKLVSLGYYDGSVEKLPRGNVVYMGCDPHYPSVYPESSLLMLGKLNAAGFVFGYSDHMVGLQAAKAAVLMGAYCIEKHFTTERLRASSSFRDHKCSMDVKELAELRDFISAHEDPEHIRKDEEGYRRVKSSA